MAAVRVLFLHGYGSSEDITDVQLKALRAAVSAAKVEATIDVLHGWYALNAKDHMDMITMDEPRLASAAREGLALCGYWKLRKLPGGTEGDQENYAASTSDPVAPTVRQACLSVG